MDIIDEITQWINQTIIQLNLCPFAALPYQKDQVKISLVNESDNEKILESFIQELEYLNAESNNSETSLLILPKMSNDFRDFNDFVGTLEDNLFEVNLHGEFQIVAFHPRFIFEGLESIDRANWVNRSPYPVLHILKTKSIADLKMKSNEGEEISFRNENRLNELTDLEVEKYFWFLKDL
jgi:hypothetical protein